MTDIINSLRRMWPVVGLILATLVYDAVFNYWLAYDVRVHPILDTVVPSSLVGQAIVAVIFGALAGRTWIAGWLLALGLTLAGIAACLSLAIFEMPDDVEEIVGAMTFAPLMVLGACIPLLALRGLSGWRLTLSEITVQPRVSSSLEDLFLLSVVVACCLALASTASNYLPNAESTALLIGPITFGCVSLFLLVPLVLATFRTKSWTMRLGSWLMLGLLELGSAILCSAAADGSWDVLSELREVFFFASIIILYVVIGLSIIVGTGFKLTRFAKSNAPMALHQSQLQSEWHRVSDGDLEMDSQAGSLHQSRRAARRMTFAVVVVTVACRLAYFGHSHQRVEYYRELKVSLSSSGLLADLRVRDDVVVSIQLKPEGTDRDLALAIGRYGHALEELNLSGTKVTDKGLLSLTQCKRLSGLDVSHTQITEAGLEPLLQDSIVRTLSVAHTKINWQHVLGLEHHELDLDLSGLGVTDDQLRSNEFKNVSSLRLSQNPITDAGVQALVASKRFRRIDLSDTEITGSAFASVSPGNCPMSLNLDGTKVTDATVQQIINKGCLNLSLRRTAITPALLPAFNTGSLGITLGKGQIKEDDLVALKGSFTHLGLNGPEFTGEHILGAGVAVGSVDLSHSSITDEILNQFAITTWISSVDLSHTKITDQGVTRIYCSELDLRGTKIHAPALRQRVYQPSRVIMDIRQLTAEEASLLRPIGVVVNESQEYR